MEDASRPKRKEYSCPQTDNNRRPFSKDELDIKSRRMQSKWVCAGFVSTECETVLYVLEFWNKVYPLQLQKPMDMATGPQGRRTNRRIDHFNYVLRALTQWEQIICHTFHRVKYLAATLIPNSDKLQR